VLREAARGNALHTLHVMAHSAMKGGEAPSELIVSLRVIVLKCFQSFCPEPSCP